MVLKITETTFITGKGKEPAKINLYDKQKIQEQVSSGKPINNIPVKPELKTPPTVDLSKINNTKLTKLKESSTQKSGFSDFTKMLTDSIKGTSNNLGVDAVKYAINALGYKGSTDIINWVNSPPSVMDVTNLLGTHVPQIKVLVDGIGVIKNVKDVKSVTGLAKLIGDIAGNKELVQVLNLGPEMAMVSGMIQSAFENNLPELADVIIEKIADDDYKRRAKIAAAGLASHYAHIDYIDSVMNEGITASEINSAYPKSINTISKNFMYSTRAEVMEKKRAQTFNDVLSKLRNEWWLYERNGEVITSFTEITGLSKAASDALKQNEKFYLLATLAEYYPEIDMVKETIKNRPYAKDITK